MNSALFCPRVTFWFVCHTFSHYTNLHIKLARGKGLVAVKAGISCRIILY